MRHQASRSNALLQLQIEQALCDALLKSGAVTVRYQGEDPDSIEVVIKEEPSSKISYPWNPADPASDGFFNQIEQEFSLNGLSEEDLNDRASVFFSQVDSLFAATSLETSLARKFATVPQTLLNAIAHRAQQLVQSSGNLADQLILCVQDVLPQWAEDDLQVLARPLAYAMRGKDSKGVVDSTVKSVRSAEWEQLSETEQARLSLAIARYALDQLESK